MSAGSPDCLLAAVPAVGPMPVALESDRQAEALNMAFSSFAATAATLERSYALLETQVRQLRGELEVRNAELETQLAHNRAMRASLDQVFQQMPCGVVVARSDGKVLSANPEALRLLGGSCVGETAAAMLALPTADPRASSADLELPPHRGWLHVHWALLLPSEEREYAFILLDATEARRSESERAQKERQQALGEMAALLAHEVRNPLGSLELFAGLLENAGLQGEQRVWIDQLQAGLRLLASTVNNILYVHSLPRLQPTVIELDSLLGWVRDFLAPVARLTSVQLLAESSPSGIIFAADRHRLEQVLLNLGLNALRAMPNGGRLEFHGTQVRCDRAEAVRIEVSDTGVGLDPDTCGRIFETGFSRHSGGAGLGLSVCRTIVEQHGGSIAAATNAGQGATFKVQLPLGVEA